MSSVATGECNQAKRCTSRRSLTRGACGLACIWLVGLMGGCPQPVEPDVPPAPSVARLWNEVMLEAIRLDTGRPTVAARNLFHVSVAMYDAWATYDAVAVGYLVREKAAAIDVEAARQEAISFAAYRVLSHRFASAPNAAQTQALFDALMNTLGYDPGNTSTTGDSPAAVGNRIGAAVIAFGLGDGSNEANNYADTTGYMPVNPPLDILQTGVVLDDPNRWQPLIVDGRTQVFLTPQWGGVTPFALPAVSPTRPYFSASVPPQLGGLGDPYYKAQAQRVIRYSSWLDPDDGAVIDISPAVRGNNTLGTDDGLGHPINPVTGEPYAPNFVLRGDWGRVIAEYWADGRGTFTPPGHWNEIANHVSDELAGNKRIGGVGPVVSDLEWDVKLYFALNAAAHDAAIAAWDNKRFYDYARPTSIVRYTGGLGQSSAPTGLSFNPLGLPLVPGLIEVITAESTAPGQRHAHLAGHEGQIAVRSWQGPPAEPTSAGGVRWILAGDWLPYQASDFVTPSFPGYVSGHSTFSRSAAEVLTLFTGSEFFPGGLGEFVAPAGEFLKFEFGPRETVVLQWGTYYDAADEAGQSRVWGGIHVTIDDYAGRRIGSMTGKAAFYQAQEYFAGQAVNPPMAMPAQLR